MEHRAPKGCWRGIGGIPRLLAHLKLLHNPGSVSHHQKLNLLDGSTEHRALLLELYGQIRRFLGCL